MKRNKVELEEDADLIRNGLRDNTARWICLIVISFFTLALPTSVGYAVGNVIEFTASNSLFAIWGFGWRMSRQINFLSQGKVVTYPMVQVDILAFPGK